MKIARIPRIDFVGNIGRWAIISGLLIAVSFGSLLIRGLNLSIDFEGGTAFLLEEVPNDVTADDLADAAEGAGATGVVAQVSTEGGRVVAANIRTAAIEPGSEEETAVADALEEVSGADDVQTSFVGPSWGEAVSRKALEALVVFLAVVILYISVRLEFKMAVAAVLALAHDVFITIGLYSLVGFSVSPSTVIALLTILGYSLYDSVVIFDRIDENSHLLGGPGKRTYSQMVNTSMNEVLWRSINTSITSLLPVGALLVIGSQLLGATTLQDLALALFIGMAIGAYSSLFVAGPFLAWWKERDPDNLALRRKYEQRAEEGEVDVAADVEAVQASRAPITTDYVRGEGRKKRRRR
jgi:preprotein translocase subunit SecF